MFDIGWSELLILGVVTLVFVGPKELPVFLRTIGRYAGMLRRQASEFREQFDAAMREAELEQIRKDMANLRTDVESSVRAAERDISSELEDARRGVAAAAEPEGRPAAESPAPVQPPPPSLAPEAPVEPVKNGA